MSAPEFWLVPPYIGIWCSAHTLWKYDPSHQFPWLFQVAAAFLVDPPEALIVARVRVSLSHLAIVPLETATGTPISLVMKSLSLWSSLSLVLAKYSFISLTRNRHSSSVHLSVMVGPYGWFGLAFLTPNTGWKVTESSNICIEPWFRSDGLLTVARAMIMTVFSVRHV